MISESARLLNVKVRLCEKPHSGLGKALITFSRIQGLLYYLQKEHHERFSILPSLRNILVADGPFASSCTQTPIHLLHNSSPSYHISSRTELIQRITKNVSMILRRCLVRSHLEKKLEVD